VLIGIYSWNAMLNTFKLQLKCFYLIIIIIIIIILKKDDYIEKQSFLRKYQINYDDITTKYENYNFYKNRFNN